MDLNYSMNLICDFVKVFNCSSINTIRDRTQNFAKLTI